MGTVGDDGEYIPDGKGSWPVEVRKIVLQHLVNKHGASQTEAELAYEKIGPWTVGPAMFEPGHAGIKDAAVLALQEIRQP